MGYTHYFYTKPELDKTKFKKLVKDVKKLLSDTTLLCYEYNQVHKKPQVTDEVIMFNGKGEDGHETFLLSRKSIVTVYQSDKSMAFNFCKTACKPYDRFVVAVLILAKSWLGNDIRVSSDGELQDWQAGKKLVEETFNRKINLNCDTGNGGIEVELVTV